MTPNAVDCYATCDDSEQKAGIFPHREHENRKFVVEQESPLPISREASFQAKEPVNFSIISSNAHYSPEIKSVEPKFKSSKDKAIEEIVRQKLNDARALDCGTLAVLRAIFFYQ